MEPPLKQSPSKRMASSKSLENLTSQSGDYSFTRILCLLFKVSHFLIFYSLYMRNKLEHKELRSITVTDSQEGLNNVTAPSQVKSETRIIPKTL